MHGGVRGVGDQLAVAVEHCAGKVEPFLDVGRPGGLLQAHSHLLGNGHEEVVEHLKHDRIDLTRDHLGMGLFLEAGHDNVGVGIDPCLPARLDNDGADIFENDRGADDLLARFQMRAPEHLRFLPLSAGIKARRFDGDGRFVDFRQGRFHLTGAATGGLDVDHLHDQWRFRHQEAELFAVDALEMGGHFGAVGEGNLDGGVGALIAQMQVSTDPDVVRGNTLADQVPREARYRCAIPDPEAWRRVPPSAAVRCCSGGPP